jgi:hypothetical protein
MKKTIIALSLIVLIAGCTKIDIPQPASVDLGVKSTSTAIKSINQSGNIITANFETTIGSKYSVQIVPFGSEQPIKREGFTANETTTQKTYDLSGLPKKDYDLIFIDIDGKEVKYPIIIK